MEDHQRLRNSGAWEVSPPVTTTPPMSPFFEFALRLTWVSRQKVLEGQTVGEWLLESREPGLSKGWDHDATPSHPIQTRAWAVTDDGSPP